MRRHAIFQHIEPLSLLSPAASAALAARRFWDAQMKASAISAPGAPAARLDAAVRQRPTVTFEAEEALH